MNQNYSNDQFFGNENFQTTITNLASQSNLGQATGSSTGNFPYVTSVQDASIYSQNQHYNMIQYPQHQQTLQLTSATNSTVVQDNFAVNPPVYPVHSLTFFYRP